MNLPTKGLPEIPSSLNYCFSISLQRFRMEIWNPSCSGIRTINIRTNQNVKSQVKNVKHIIVAEMCFTEARGRLCIYSQVKNDTLQMKMWRHCMSYGETVTRQGGVGKRTEDCNKSHGDWILQHNLCHRFVNNAVTVNVKRMLILCATVVKAIQKHKTMHRTMT
jgi:hypothetical protein